MVAAEADWLYNLEEWNDIFDEETRKELYKEQKSSTTIVKEQKVYPNDPSPGNKLPKAAAASLYRLPHYMLLISTVPLNS